MQYDVLTPADYLEALPEDWRKETVLLLRSIITRQQPALKEQIEYKMLAYALKDKTVFHLNAQKNYVSLYVGNIAKVEGSDTLLRGLDCGKGCIRIRKSVRLEDTDLEAFIARSVALYAEGGDADC